MLYSKLCDIYEKLEKTSKRLEKTEILSDFIKKLNIEEKEIIYLLQGRVFPDYDSREIGISTQLVIKSLEKSSGTKNEEIVKLWKKLGDLGEVASLIIKRKKQATLFSKRLEAEKVLSNIRKLTEFEGKGTIEKKISLITELLNFSNEKEAKYVVRTLLQDLRIGIGEGILRDAILYAFFGKEDKEALQLIQEAYDKTLDFAKVFELSIKGKEKLKNIELIPGKPVKVMLALKVKDIKEGFEVTGKPAAFEFKYDGFRMLISKDEKNEVRIFTRRLEDVTNQFPEVKEYVKKFVNAKTFIIDAEAVGYDSKTKKYRPFQEISQRIKRKYEISKLEKELPVEINVFDILYYNGKNLLNIPFLERRKILEKIIKPEKYKLKLAEQIITDKEKEAELFYKKALQNGQEGLMIKNINGIYKPGARVGYMVKLKPTQKELDLVITEAEFGTGKRAGWLTSFNVACKDKEGLREVGKVSTGLKEKSGEGTTFEEITKILKPLIIKEKGRKVELKPKIVITVTYQEIQKSPSYNSGYALRFPRFIALRIDKSIDDIATLEEIEKEYLKQERSI
ncbi:MAG: ATP-dependent DNA ligase [Candidatus Pacearchaeota archaeon]